MKKILISVMLILFIFLVGCQGLTEEELKELQEEYPNLYFDEYGNKRPPTGEEIKYQQDVLLLVTLERDIEKFYGLSFEEQIEWVDGGFFSKCDVIADFCRIHSEEVQGCDRYCAGRYESVENKSKDIISLIILVGLIYIVFYNYIKRKK